MLKFTSSFAIIVVLLSSCLERPDKRAPRLPTQSDPSASEPADSTCASFDPVERALHSRCNVDPSVLVKPVTDPRIPEPGKTATTDTTKFSDETNSGEATRIETPPDPLEDSVSLAAVGVSASCGDGYGCLYSQGGGSKYWLKCEIRAGGCKDGFLVEAKTETGSPQVKRSSMCKDGDKTVADLSRGKIELECKTDREVLRSFAAKRAKLVLSKSHLSNRHICVTTDAGPSGRNVVDFGSANLTIAAGACATDAHRIRFSMQLGFSW